MKEEYKDYYIFLEDLRQSGRTNMFEAIPYLVEAFNLTETEAIEILANWMANYNDICEKYYKERPIKEKTNMKKLYRYYTTYGKGSGEELRNQGVIEDTAEARKDLVDEYTKYADDSYGTDEFINGSSNTFEVYTQSDWDDPTGGHLVLEDKDVVVKRIREDADKSIKEIEDLFKGEE